MARNWSLSYLISLLSYQASSPAGMIVNSTGLQIGLQFTLGRIRSPVRPPTDLATDFTLCRTDRRGWAKHDHAQCVPKRRMTLTFA